MGNAIAAELNIPGFNAFQAADSMRLVIIDIPVKLFGSALIFTARNLIIIPYNYFLR
jgi:hypothetical protein